MENEKEPGLITVLSNLFIAYLKRFTELIHLAELEAKLAVKTLIQIFILLYFSTLLLLTAWLSLLGVLFFYLTSLHFTPLFAACVIAALNILLILLIAMSIFIIKKNLFFPATRRQLQLTVANEEGIQHERTETSN